MRAIDGDALQEQLQNLAYDDWNQGVSTSWADAYREVADMVFDMPTIEAEPVRKGKWKAFDLTWGRSIYACSACGNGCDVPTETGKPIYDFCPNCGARMSEGEDPIMTLDDNATDYEFELGRCTQWRNDKAAIKLLRTAMQCRYCKFYKEGLLKHVKFCYRTTDLDDSPVAYIFNDNDFCSYWEGKHNGSD